jgi:hypothetical protein
MQSPSRKRRVFRIARHPGLDPGSVAISSTCQPAVAEQVLDDAAPLFA